jgi:hypothetical protein
MNNLFRNRKKNNLSKTLFFFILKYLMDKKKKSRSRSRDRKEKTNKHHKEKKDNREGKSKNWNEDKINDVYILDIYYFRQ